MTTVDEIGVLRAGLRPDGAADVGQSVRPDGLRPEDPEGWSFPARVHELAGDTGERLRRDDDSA